MADSKPSGSTSSAGGASTERVSTDKYRNYAVVAGVVTGLGALGWYLKSNAKKPEVQDWGWHAFQYRRTACFDGLLKTCFGRIEG